MTRFNADLNIFNKKEIYRKQSSFSNSAVYVPENSKFPYISIIRSKKCESPFSISSEEHFTFQDKIFVDEKGISFGNVSITKDDDSVFDSRYCIPEKVLLNMRSLKKYMSFFFAYSKTGIPYDKYFNIEAIFEYTEISELLKKMEGYGKGLTPEGDDFISGYNIGMEILGKQDKKYINYDLNRYSKNLDVLFSDLMFPEFLHDLLDDLLSSNDVSKEKILSTIRKTSGFGNTTGYSICDGIFCGLSQ